ncbi:MAG: malonate decarboxylase acyl carrier protein [Syntrophorhabdales bacterium]|jgi:malonate decarboxylase delta subunit
MRKKLNRLDFEFKADKAKDFPADFVHYGVVGSGDMEIIIEKKPLDGAIRVTVLTPVSGFDEVWRRVLYRFVKETHIGNASIEINDCNATPVVGSLRLRQALAEIS